MNIMLNERCCANDVDNETSAQVIIEKCGAVRDCSERSSRVEEDVGWSSAGFVMNTELEWSLCIADVVESLWSSCHDEEFGRWRFWSVGRVGLVFDPGIYRTVRQRPYTAGQLDSGGMVLIKSMIVL